MWAENNKNIDDMFHAFLHVLRFGEQRGVTNIEKSQSVTGILLLKEIRGFVSEKCDVLN